MNKFAPLTIAIFAAASSAQVIDFEAFPNLSSPADNVELDRNVVFTSNGVGASFGFDSTGNGLADVNAVFERVGRDSQEGFYANNVGNGRDVALAGSLGTYFLRHHVALGDNPEPFIITFDQGVGATSGEIWDIDARGDGSYEQWLVTGYDAAGGIVDQIASPVGLKPSEAGNLDSLGWTFSLNALGSAIDRVTIEYTGTAKGVGLAFDNFSAAAVPAPAAAAVLGLAGLGIARRRR
ncbi:MAG: hypothetical protein AAF747_05285 [Planctomycetota bacterium]